MPTMSNDKLNISLRVDSALYHITIRREDERAYRMAEKLVNDRLNYYATKFPGQNQDDYLRRMALDVALAFCRNQDRNETKPFIDSIKALTKDIEEKLQDNS